MLKTKKTSLNDHVSTLIFISHPLLALTLGPSSLPVFFREIVNKDQWANTWPHKVKVKLLLRLASAQSGTRWEVKDVCALLLSETIAIFKQCCTVFKFRCRNSLQHCSRCYIIQAFLKLQFGLQRTAEPLHSPGPWSHKVTNTIQVILAPIWQK